MSFAYITHRFKPPVRRIFFNICRIFNIRPFYRIIFTNNNLQLKLYDMKRVYFLVCFAGVMILFVNTGCKKESPVIGSGNRPPIADAGFDFAVELISNEMTLSGQATDPGNRNGLSSTWTKIAGPACTIVSPQSLTTRVSNLTAGEYQFELLVSDNHGATDRDTVVVKTFTFTFNIGSLSNQVNFFNLSWMCPMGCTISISNIFSYIPPNSPIRVFIKGVNQAGWQEAIPISQYGSLNSIYYYEFYNNRFVVYTEVDAYINADVRIFF